VWLRLYLNDLGDPLEPNEPLWWTLRRRDRGDGLHRRPMTYETLRAVFRRVNTVLGSNWTMHDLRHTAALRMSRDDSLSLRDVHTILGHAHLSTTGDVYLSKTRRRSSAGFTGISTSGDSMPGRRCRTWPSATTQTRSPCCWDSGDARFPARPGTLNRSPDPALVTFP
jgi:Phage integrase family